MSGRRRRIASSSSSSSEFSDNSYSITEDHDSISSSESMTDSLSSEYAAAVGKGLKTLKCDGLFSDITLKVGDKSIKCHKLILCIFSGYFRSMFQSGMKESKQSEVTLEMLDPVAVEAVIDYMYSGNIFISENSAEDILATVLYLQVESLKGRCEEEILLSMTPDSVFSVWKFSDVYTECTALRKHCIQYSVKYFKTVIESENFLDIDLENLICLLSHDNLKVFNEDTVLIAVVKWVKHDRASRIPTLKEILPHVRMPLVSFVELDKLKEEFPEVMKKPVLQYIQEAETYKRDIARQMTISSSRTEYRRYHRKEKVLLIISGMVSKQFSIPTRKMWCYSYHSNAWLELARVPKTPEYGFAACTFGESNLYIAVGGDHSRFYNYSGLINEWKTCPNVRIGRMNHSMVAAHNSIYFLGGCGFLEASGSTTIEILEKIEAYNVSEEVWREVGELQIPVLDCTSVVGPSNKIYIFGGYSDLVDQRSNIVQCFDTNTSTCTVITKDPGIKWVLGATSSNSNIFVANGENIYNFITENNEFKKIGQRTNVLIGMGMAQKESQIAFVGGEGLNQEAAVEDFLEGREADTDKTSDDVILYDVISGKESVWDISLPERLADVGCKYLVVDKRILD